MSERGIARSLISIEELMKYIENFIKEHGYPPKTIRIARMKFEILYRYDSKDETITFNCLL